MQRQKELQMYSLLFSNRLPTRPPLELHDEVERELDRTGIEDV